MTDQGHLFPGKEFISTVLDALDTKTRMSGGLARVYLMRAAMAGAIIGVMYLTAFSVVDVFASIGSGELYGIGRLVGALFFGFALVFIYFSKSELLTSNMMFVAVGGYFRRINCLRSFRVLTMCFIGNFLGGLAIALIVMGSTLVDGGVGDQMSASVDVKLAFVTAGPAGWSDLFMRAVLCNFMINLAMVLVYNGMIKDAFTKSLAMIISVFIFVFVGFEHSVANTVLFTIQALNGGIDVGLAFANLGIVLAGNFVGGGLLIGFYYAYANDDRRYLRKQRGKQPESISD
ncbi:formate/nitrite transporter family protein [Demequina oxidasica]|uniref:formate/nitrite transporter family protein n=1 Tax=Demequina oxidasica TaxID=676199 RepID=UPI0007812AAD|nr:formate/nitrite transporter family protein [Demequina oxidasica]